MTVNYQENGIDLDYTYINANDVQYFPLETLNVTGRKVVMIGQNYQSTYPLGNVGSAFTLSNLNVPKIDQDNASLVAALPTAVVYQNRNYPNQTQIRGQFNLAENYPQTIPWNSTITFLTYPYRVGYSNNWKQVIAGGFHSHILKSDNTAWSTGRGSEGEMGNGSTLSQSSPVQVLLSNIASIHSSWRAYNSCAIKTDGTLWSWGYNNSGQLGNGTTSTSNPSPIQIGTHTNWSKVACGYSMKAIQSNGTLWVWGSNNNGALGLGDTTNRLTPVQVGSGTNWSEVATNGTIVSAFTLAIKTDGTLWSWGYNDYSQLGLNTTTAYSSPVQVGALTNWSKVACGYYHSFAIKTDGTLWAWGRNNIGCLGLSDQTNRSTPVQVGSGTWKYISASNNCSAGIKTDGTLWTWGLNSYGQLGLSDQSNRYSPCQVGTSSDWEQVSLGVEHLIALKSDGSVWSCGSLTYGNLGIFETGLPVTKLNYGL